MLYLVAGYLKPEAEGRLIDFHDDFNEHLTRSEIRVAGVMRNEKHHRSGYLALIEVPTRDDAEGFLKDSPYWRADLYSQTEIFEFQVEVGRVLD